MCTCVCMIIKSLDCGPLVGPPPCVKMRQMESTSICCLSDMQLDNASFVSTFLHRFELRHKSTP